MRPLIAAPRLAAPSPASSPIAPKPAAPKPPRRSVAPTRLAFRLERLWLTPVVRLVTRVGVPVFCVTLGLGLWLGDPGRRADLIERFTDVKTQVENRPEFQLTTLGVEGASPEVEAAVTALVPVALPASRFALDLEYYRAAILRLDAVKAVSLVVQPGGTLSVKITERTPVILWRTALGLEMLDETGHRTASLTRRDARPDLPLLAGEGADRAVPEALAILAVATPILARARGLVRVGERRWNIVLDRNQTIMLPEKNPVQAIERALALDAAEDLFNRDFTRLDLRAETRPTVQLTAPALASFQAIGGQSLPSEASQ